MDTFSELIRTVSSPAFVVLLGFSGVAGLLAVFSPERFKAVSNKTDRWVDTTRWLEVLDKPVNIDQHVLRHTRLFGVAVLAAVAVLTFVVTR